MVNQKNYLTVSKRLLIFVGITLILTVAVFSYTYFFSTQRFLVSWLVFECGIIGGFVSIQQRLKSINETELAILSQSWASILLIPVYGGIFSLLLYVLFLSSLIQGSSFPKFYIPEFSQYEVTANDIHKFLTETYPQSGPDLAKLIFWSFCAGFSERFVPQIIQSITSQSNNDDESKV
jgi:hypothetical protein